MLYTILKHSGTELEVAVKVCVKNISKLVYCKVFIRRGFRGYSVYVYVNASKTEIFWCISIPSTI